MESSVCCNSSNVNCAVCEMFPSTLEGDTPEFSGTPLCADCYWDIDSAFRRKRAKARWANATSNWVMKLKCEICSDNFDYNPVTGDDQGRFCSELCQDKYFRSEAEEPEDIDYVNGESHGGYEIVFEDIPKPSDFAPGKVYEEGCQGLGFYSCVVVKKDGTLCERHGPFTDRTKDGHTIFQTWEDWREYCRWHMVSADEE